MQFTAFFDIPSSAAASVAESDPSIASEADADAARSEWGRHAMAWAGVNRVVVADATGSLHHMCVAVNIFLAVCSMHLSQFSCFVSSILTQRESKIFIIIFS